MSRLTSLLRPLAAVGGVLCMLARAGDARADDWLAVWPACSMSDAFRPVLSLMYPAPGLPAVVHAGEPLWARLRVPAALTPPPGVQQERVLAGYAAELTGSPLRVGAPAGERHRHILPVLSIRPDGSDSLVYRVRIEIPAYLAPGTYSFALRTPYGTRGSQHALRVLAAGATLRIARLPAGVLLPPPAAGTRPIDVWLSGEGAERVVAQASGPSGGAGDAVSTPTLADAAPTLLAEGSALALRIGGELWVRSGCGSSAAFERDVAAVLSAEKLRRVAWDSERPAPPLSAAELSSQAALAVHSDSVEIDNRAGVTAAELSILLPFGASVTSRVGDLAFYPASELGAREPTTKLARWRVPQGALATLRVGVARTTRTQLVLRPARARSGQEVRMRIVGADSGAQVAFALGFARSAYASRELHTTFLGRLDRPVRAQVFAADGAGQVVNGHVWVEPHRPPNCAIIRLGAPGEPRLPLPWLAAAALGRVLVRRLRLAKNARLGRALE